MDNDNSKLTNGMDYYKKYFTEMDTEEWIRKNVKPCDKNGYFDLTGHNKDGYIIPDCRVKCDRWERCKREKPCMLMINVPMVRFVEKISETPLGFKIEYSNEFKERDDK